MKTVVEKAKEYATRVHRLTNHFYGEEKPYEFHLNMVYEIALKHIHVIPEGEQLNVLAGCWVHDVIEDCRQTYNDVKNATNETVAELAYALTNEKGKTRKDRANAKYYQGIREVPYADFIKICDRAANYQYSVSTGSSMAKKYKQEMPEFINQVGGSFYMELLKELE